MKKLFILSITALIAVATYAGDPNEKVLNSFTELFAGAEQVRWSEFDSTYLVSFTYAGIQSTARYDKKGKMLYCIRYYSYQLLPVYILSQLKKEYGANSFHSVTEHTRGKNVCYYVRITDEKDWITVKVDETGYSMETERFRKG